LHVLAQQQLGVRRCHPQSIDPDVLASHIAADPNDITLVGRHHRQFILLEKSGYRRVTLVALFAGFYRERESRSIVKSEADDGVGNGLASPI